MQLVPSPPRIVRARTGQSGSTNVRADIGMTQRLPPCEPRMALLSAPTGDDDEVRNHQQHYEKSDCYQDAGPDFHCSAPSNVAIRDCNPRSAHGPACKV